MSRHQYIDLVQQKCQQQGQLSPGLQPLSRRVPVYLEIKQRYDQLVAQLWMVVIWRLGHGLDITWKVNPIWQMLEIS
ncbi:MAG: hypothetical protein CL712_03575 [Chloroflexi bacterium]|nr:hypothetical protein [Chloroflexota bacterium]|tara:strand:+ start:428 stop:658 length:231 start_codon:yes stop_codon:yes gene_type:complete